MARKPNENAIETYIAELTEAFNARRCDICGGVDVRVICSRSEPEPETNLCLDCAPWLVRPLMPTAVRSVDNTVDRATA